MEVYVREVIYVRESIRFIFRKCTSLSKVLFLTKKKSCRMVYDEACVQGNSKFGSTNDSILLLSQVPSSAFIEAIWHILLSELAFLVSSNSVDFPVNAL